MTHFLECFCVEVSLLCRNGTVSKLHCVEMTGIPKNRIIVACIDLICSFVCALGAGLRRLRQQSIFTITPEVFFCLARCLVRQSIKWTCDQPATNPTARHPAASSWII